MDALQGEEALKYNKCVWRGLLVLHHTKSKLTHGDDTLPVMGDL